MKTTINLLLTTTDGRMLLKVDARHHGDPATMERYFSPSSEIEIVCSTAEREDCEGASTNDLDLDADVLTGEQFIELASWLKTNAALRIEGAFKNHQ